MRDYEEYEEVLDEDEYEDEEIAPRKRSGMILPLVGGTLVTTEILSAMIKGGPLGVGGGLLASAFVWWKGQDLIDGAQQLFDWSALTGHLPKLKGGRSFKDRALGHYPDETPDYDVYITSPEWKVRARQIRKRDGYTCQDCGATDVPLDVHHLTYEHLGHERDEDLITLCRECHDAQHNEDIYDDEDEMEDLSPRPGKQQRADDEIARPQRKRSGIFLFSDVLKDFTPSLDKIYLGTLASGGHVFCRAKHLCHVALAGPTRGGKSSLMRMLLAQLCYAGASVLILNPHYSRYIHADEGDYEDQDWTPFEPYLMYDPIECRKYEVIEHYLRQAATELLPKRLEQFARSQPLGKPYFIALDELPAIIDAIPDVPKYMAKILREGAKVGIFLIVASHDFLVKTISPNGAGGAVRECYRTAFYAGGDATTAKILLDMPANKLPEDELGRGTIMLRNWQTCKKAALASAPLLDNRALYTLLGASTYKPEKQQSRGTELTGYRDDPITDPQVRAARPDAIRLYTSGVRQSTRRSEREKRLRNAAPVHTPLVARVPDPPVQDEVEISAQDAFAVWSAGNSNVRDLAKAMGITVYQATKLYGAMVDAGLIERKTKVVVKGSID